MSKLLTVFGATGNQGGAVIESVLSHPTLSKTYRLRGITRDPSKPAALKLKEKGVDVVKADLLDKESLKQVIQGSSAVFAVTNFWEKATKANEVAQGRNVASVCKECGIELLIWSTLPHVTKMTSGALKHVTHFDSKAEVGEYIEELGVPYAFFVPGFYMSNITGSIKKTENGLSYASTFTPTTPVPLLSPGTDTGLFVSSLLSHYPATLGTSILGASGWYTPAQIVDTITAVSGQKCTYTQLSEAQLKAGLMAQGQAGAGGGGMSEEKAEEIVENFRLVTEWGYFGPGGKEGVEDSIKLLDTKPTTFKQFVERNKTW
ncbi:MAG: hypothetical protein M1819_004068 [Sarea resinae]|nr:MAG: hypothetical protein M1819_004068 [Sarea resinae]